MKPAAGVTVAKPAIEPTQRPTSPGRPWCTQSMINQRNSDTEAAISELMAAPTAVPLVARAEPAQSLQFKGRKGGLGFELGMDGQNRKTKDYRALSKADRKVITQPRKEAIVGLSVGPNEFGMVWRHYHGHRPSDCSVPLLCLH